VCQFSGWQQCEERGWQRERYLATAGKENLSAFPHFRVCFLFTFNTGGPKMPKNFPSSNKSEWKIFENHHKQLFGKRGNRFSGGGFFFYLGSSLIGFTWTNWSAAAHTSLSLCEKYKINAGTSVCENIYDTHPLTRSHTHLQAHAHV